jgi:hypothetical protein
MASSVLQVKAVKPLLAGACSSELEHDLPLPGTIANPASDLGCSTFSR